MTTPTRTSRTKIALAILAAILAAPILIALFLTNMSKDRR